MDTHAGQIHGCHTLQKSARLRFCYLLSVTHNSFMSRAKSIVIPGGKLDVAMQLILTPLILQLVERKRRAS